LILFSDTGGGHRASAQALVEAIRVLDPRAGVELFDPLIGSGPPLVRRFTSLYAAAIQSSPAAWAAIYHTSNLRPAFAALRAALGVQVPRVLGARIQADDPEVVVSVHPLLNHLARTTISRSGDERPLVTVVTDLVRFHRGWACPDARLVVVPTEEARDLVVSYGVPADRVSLLGLPIDPRFRPSRAGERTELRRRFQLDVDRPTILVTGGGEGAGNLHATVGALAAHRNPWQVVAVCGRNDSLRRRLQEERFATPTLVLGFVDAMPELVRASDLVVGKAGPGTISESLASHVPLILTSYLHGQESANVGYVCAHHLGMYVPNAPQLEPAVQSLLAHDGARLAYMAQRTRAFARSHATMDIAERCLRIGAGAAA
jgi:1,2-diacylglycerol 3-beta-galactosyltransferase